MNQRLTSQFYEDFIKNYNEESDDGYLIKVDAQYLQKIHELLNDLPFLPEKMKLGKIKKLITNLLDKTEYVIHITNLKQELNRRLVFEKIS